MNKVLCTLTLLSSTIVGCGSPTAPVVNVQTDTETPVNVTVPVVKTNQATVILHFNERVSYSAWLEDTDQRIYSLGAPQDPGDVEWTIRDLTPGTTYLIAVKTMDARTRIASTTYEAFTTLVEPTPPAPPEVKPHFTDVECVQDGVIVTFSYKLSGEARVYIYLKNTWSEAPWTLNAFSNYEVQEGSVPFDFEMFDPNTRVFYRLEARNSADEIVDTYESMFYTSN